MCPKLNTFRVAQYKNKYNFANLCMHKLDFGFGAEWNFFATAHGKFPCDGIGGNIKRVTATESLKTPKRCVISANNTLMKSHSFTFLQRKSAKYEFPYKVGIHRPREYQEQGVTIDLDQLVLIFSKLCEQVNRKVVLLNFI